VLATLSGLEAALVKSFGTKPAAETKAKLYVSVWARLGVTAGHLVKNPPIVPELKEIPLISWNKNIISICF
jgi:hypothetical protein